MRRLVPLLLPIVLLTGPAGAEALPGPVAASLLRVIDGDTLELRVRIWLDQELVVKARLAGVDAPELTRPACGAERTLAEQARDVVAAALSPDAALVLTDVEHDKYAGRVVARVRDAEGRDLSDLLLQAGLAAPYGDARDWCADP